jgi:hypothetical protein
MHMIHIHVIHIIHIIQIIQGRDHFELLQVNEPHYFNQKC